MATTDELLALADKVDDDSTNVDRIVVSDDLRTLAIPSSITNVGVEADRNTKRLYFSVPTTTSYGTVDLTSYTPRINYENANGEKGTYTATDTTIENDRILFSWLIGKKTVAYNGNVRFNVCMKKLDRYGNILHEYNTTPVTLPCLEGLEPSNSWMDEADLPVYSGETEVTPSAVEQILPTANTVVYDDITVQAVTYDLPAYSGEVSITPNTEEQVLSTKNTVVSDDISVHSIPYAETSNGAGGTTIIIA